VSNKEKLTKTKGSDRCGGGKNKLSKETRFTIWRVQTGYHRKRGGNREQKKPNEKNTKKGGEGTRFSGEVGKKRPFRYWPRGPAKGGLGQTQCARDSHVGNRETFKEDGNDQLRKSKKTKPNRKGSKRATVA